MVITVSQFIKYIHEHYITFPAWLSIRCLQKYTFKLQNHLSEDFNI